MLKTAKKFQIKIFQVEIFQVEIFQVETFQVETFQVETFQVETLKMEIGAYFHLPAAQSHSERRRCVRNRKRKPAVGRKSSFDRL